MTGEEFFPTPPALIRQMLKGFQFHYKDPVLVPFARKGDLIEEIKNYCEKKHYLRDYQDSIDAIENDPNLRKNLKSKGIRVVHSGFFTFSTLKRYKYVFMIPPLSVGVEHLAKALEFLKPGGKCVCLLDAEILRNPRTTAHKALVQKLKEWQASIKYVRNAFKRTNRNANAEAAIVNIVCQKDYEQANIKLKDFLRSELTDDEKQMDCICQNVFVGRDNIQAAVNQFQVSVKAAVDAVCLVEQLQPILSTKFDPPQSDRAEFRSRFEPFFKAGIEPNKLIQGVRKKFWEALFLFPELIDPLTSDLRGEFRDHVERLKDYDFTLENIIAFNDEIGQKFTCGIRDAILDCYDKFGGEHNRQGEMSRNTHDFNGWIPGKAYYMNKKVVIPSSGYDGWSGKFKVRYSAVSGKLSDLERILAFLEDGETPLSDINDSLSSAENCGQTKDVQLRDFSVTFFKKGTTHITFTNLDALRRLNIYCCRKKNWLPPDYGITPYEELSPKARQVIDSFSAEGEPIPKDKPSNIGEKSYREVCLRRDELIVESKIVSPLMSCELPGNNQS